MAPEPMTEVYPPACIHGDGLSLCQACQAEYETDPTAYLEFGEHPAGQAAWAAEVATMSAWEAEQKLLPHGEPDQEIPF